MATAGSIDWKGVNLETKRTRDCLAPVVGLEPTTVSLEVRCSIQLSYTDVIWGFDGVYESALELNLLSTIRNPT